MIIGQDKLEDSLLSYIHELEKPNYQYQFNFALEGLTKASNNLNLGFSCFALKLKYILNSKDLKPKYLLNWSDYINSFQVQENHYFPYSYFDKGYYLEVKRINARLLLKEGVKKTLNISNKYNFESQSSKIKAFIKAETKQAISSLNEVSMPTKHTFADFPSSKDEIYKYLDSFDWSKPWNAGAQFASLSAFSSQENLENQEIKDNLKSFILTKLNKDSGLYYTGVQNSQHELINGCMKVITGLEWLEQEIHYPKKIIDFCLKFKITKEACDLLDLVYVLSKCLEVTNYKKLEVNNYLKEVESKIMENFKPLEGGFSYSKNQSQKMYYGVKVTNGMNYADLHGTMLLTWALALIFNTRETNSRNWKVLKP